MKKPFILLDKHPHIWRARQQSIDENRFSLGIHALDKALNGGISTSGVIRVTSITGIGEVSLFKHPLTTYRPHKLRVFINPPANIQAPWLTTLGMNLEQVLIVTPKTAEEALWATEQCLKSTACHCVLLWNSTINTTQARRLQVAATHNDALCLLFASPDSPNESLPIMLDLTLHINNKRLVINIIKQRHGWPVANIEVPYSWTPDNHEIQSAMLNNKSRRHKLHSVS